MVGGHCNASFSASNVGTTCEPVSVKSRRDLDKSAAKRWFRRLQRGQCSPCGAYVAVAGQHHFRCIRYRCTRWDSNPPIISTVISTTVEVALTLNADLAGGELHKWLGICPNLLYLRRRHKATFTLLFLVL